MVNESLCSSILRAISYYDVFGHPLTAEEVFHNLDEKAEIEDVRQGLALLYSENTIGTLDGFYFLKHRPKTLVNRRFRMEERARKMRKQAHRMAHFIKTFPYVRGILLTGDLSKKVASKNSDIDLLIITQADRLWICRTILILFRRVFFLNSKRWMCINYFISNEAYEIDPKNIYTAVETATAQVLWNDGAFRSFCDNNRWIYRFLPNWDQAVHQYEGKANRTSYLQTAVEWALRILPLDRMDRWLMTFSQYLWIRKYGDYGKSMHFTCTRQKSTAFGSDHHNRILDEYDRRVRSLESVVA